MFRSWILAFVLVSSTFSARAEILESFDTIESFRLADEGWMSSFIGTGETNLDYPIAVAASNNLVFFIDDGNKGLYSLDLISRKAKNYQEAFNDLTGQSGRLFVTPHNELIMVDVEGSQLLKYDFKGRKIGRFSDPLNLNTPSGVCINPVNQNLIVSDTFYSHLIEFASTGDPVALHGLRGLGKEQAGNGIIGIACNDQAIFVVSRFKPVINVFSYGGEFLGQIPRAEVNNPTAVAIDRYDRLYISDAFDDKIRVYDHRGMLAEYGGAGVGGLGFRDIKDLWVDESFLYVVDSMNRRIQVLSIIPPKHAR